jgi:hypothetical protein
VATYYFRNSNGVWNSAQSWSLSDNGPANGAIPTINDNAYFTSNSGNCTITTVAAAADRIDFTNGGTSNYTGLFTVGTNTNGTLTLSRSLALSPAMSDVTGSANIIISQGTTCAITSSGKSIHRLYYISNGQSAILNLADTLTITSHSLFEYNNGGPTVTLNGGDVRLRGTHSSLNNIRGTSMVYINPLSGTTASFNNASSFGNMTNNLIISGAGHVIFDSQLRYTTGKITYVTASGVSFTGNHNLYAINCILDTGGMTWDRHEVSPAGNKTNIISSSFNISRSFVDTSGANYTITPSGSARVNVYGNMNISTLIKAPITITGSASGRTITNLQSLKSSDIEIKINGGSITFPATITNNADLPATKIYNNSTGGTLNTTSTTLVAFAGSSLILDTNTISWGGLTAQGNNTIILSSSLTASNISLGLVSNTQPITFTGSAGWICSNLTSSSPLGRVIKLASGVEYKTTNNAYLTGSIATPLIMSSSIPSTRASWSLDPVASQYVKNVNGYKIDSSNGQTIWTTGTTSDTVNWRIGSQPSLSSYTFFID